MPTVLSLSMGRYYIRGSHSPKNVREAAAARHAAATKLGLACPARLVPGRHARLPAAWHAAAMKLGLKLLGSYSKCHQEASGRHGGRTRQPAAGADGP
jgi:hypothetical protein